MARDNLPPAAVRRPDTAVEILLRRERLWILTGLAAACLMCWAWIVPMALDMYGPMHGASSWMMADTPLLRYGTLLFAMWTVMMAGMMLPSAAPTLLLFTMVVRSHDAEHVRLVLAADLGERDGIGGNGEGAVAETVFHVDENVGEFAVVHDDGLRGVRSLALGILAHINFRFLGRDAIEIHGAADCRDGRWINRRRRRSGRRGGRGGLLLGLLSASGQERKPR